MNKIEARFEKISKYINDENIILPTRSTVGSAGYDFYAAEDIVIPALTYLNHRFVRRLQDDAEASGEGFGRAMERKYTLNEMATLTKSYCIKPTLVPTGIKCKMPDGYYLQLAVRSSLPLKHWLILANSIGIIDVDYYNNPDNEGAIFFQLVNLSPVDILIKKGDKFGQGILLPYQRVESDNAVDSRLGGFGSTTI